MGRRKIAIQEIKDTRNQQVTFTKRKWGLQKKGMELSVLTDTDVLIFARTKTGKISVFSSNNDIDSVIRDLKALPASCELRNNASVYKACFGKELQTNDNFDSASSKRKTSAAWTGGKAAPTNKMRRLDSSGASSASHYDSDADPSATLPNAPPLAFEQPGGQPTGQSDPKVPSLESVQSQLSQLPITPLQVPSLADADSASPLNVAALDPATTLRNQTIAVIANSLATGVAEGHVSNEYVMSVVATLMQLNVDPNQVISLVLLALPGAQERVRTRQASDITASANPTKQGSAC